MVQGAYLRGEGDIDHARLHLVFGAAVVEVVRERLLDLLGSNQSIVRGEGQHFVTSMFDGTRLVDVDVTRGSTQYALIGSQCRSNDRGVGLGAAHQELYQRVWSLASLTNQVACIFAVGVNAVARGLLEVSID